MKYSRRPALILAALLQVLPICRSVCTNPAVASAFAIILRWTIGIATYEAFDAVSSASCPVSFISPNVATGTVNQAFSFHAEITCYGSDTGAVVATSSLPAGLTSTNYDSPSTGHIYADIFGTPSTLTNNFKVILVAAFPGQISATTNLFMTIVTSAAPQITSQPVNKTVVAGGGATFSVGALGTLPLNYQWRLNGTDLANETNTSLALTRVRLAQSGDYAAVVANPFGMATSSAAHLTVTVPPSQNITSARQQGSVFSLSFVPIVGLTNTVMTNSTVAGGNWAVMTNIPPPASAASITLTDQITDISRFYLIGFSP